MRHRHAVATAATLGVCAAALPVRTQHDWTIVNQRDARRSRTSEASASVSGDGRYVAFASYAPLSPADADTMSDIYVLDRATGSLTLESASIEGRAVRSDCGAPSMSGDGRYLTFEAVSDDPSRSVVDVVLRDRSTDSTRRISVGPGGALSNGWSGQAVVDAAGTAVVFSSGATNLVDGPDVNGTQPDIYRFGIANRALERISVDSRGVQKHGGSTMPAVSADGFQVVFSSTASLGGDGADSLRHPVIYLRDTRTRRTTMAGAGEMPNDTSTMAAISADGRSVAFASLATNLAARDRNRSSDIFVYEVATGAVALVSRNADGAPANGSSIRPAISKDGRLIAFLSDASDMACARECPSGSEDINLLPDVFVFDRQTGLISRLSADDRGIWMEESGAPALAANGSVVAFSSRHPTSAQDVLNDFDLFVRTLIVDRH